MVVAARDMLDECEGLRAQQKSLMKESIRNATLGIIGGALIEFTFADNRDTNTGVEVQGQGQAGATTANDQDIVL